MGFAADGFTRPFTLRARLSGGYLRYRQARHHSADGGWPPGRSGRDVRPNGHGDTAVRKAAKTTAGTGHGFGAGVSWDTNRRPFRRTRHSRNRETTKVASSANTGGRSRPGVRPTALVPTHGHMGRVCIGLLGIIRSVGRTSRPAPRGAWRHRHPGISTAWSRRFGNSRRCPSSWWSATRRSRRRPAATRSTAGPACS